MIPTKSQTPHVPLSCEEIISDVKNAYSIGITMVHLHARSQDVSSCYDKNIYAKIISGIRNYAPDLVICVSTSGRMYAGLEQRSDVLFLENDLKPDMASLTLSSLNFNTNASINEPQIIMDLARIMKEKGIKPELEAFDSGMINYSKYLIKKKLMSEPYYFNLILGNIACAQANLLSAGLMVSELPQESVFSFGGIGDMQLRVNSMSISMGYGVRVGLEDNIWYDKERTTLATNVMLLERIINIAAANQRKVMTPVKLREYLGLCEGNGNYGIK